MLDAPSNSSRPGLAAFAIKAPIIVLAWLIGLLMLVLGATAIYYSNLPVPSWRLAVAALYATLFLGAVIYWRGGWRSGAAVLALFLGVLGWWLLIPARNDRDWIPELSVLPTAQFDGDVVTVRNVRDFRWRTTEDFDARYEQRRYDLAELVSLDLIVSSWGMDAIAHTFFSFGFADGRHLAISVESRREDGETYHPIAGMFKQFELIYVIGDERDVIGSRAGPRGETVRLYPLVNVEPRRMRDLLRDLLRTADRLNDRPRFYRSIGQNCTTTLVKHVNVVLDEPVKFHRYLLLNGRIDELLHARGSIPHDAPFEEIRRRHQLGDDAADVDRGSVEYSQAIRQPPINDQG